MLVAIRSSWRTMVDAKSEIRILERPALIQRSTLTLPIEIKILLAIGWRSIFPRSLIAFLGNCLHV